MTTILRFILLFLLAPVFAIVVQAAGAVQADFRIVDAVFQADTVVLESVDGGICNYDSSGALLHQRRSLDGKGDDTNGLSECRELEILGAARPYFSFLAEFVATKKLDNAPIQWPPNRGFEYSGQASLIPGTKVDRFGSNSGTFVAPDGTPFPQRSLPDGFQNKPLNTFEVLKPIEVDAGPSAPWFNQPGGGLQFELPGSVDDLINSGHLRQL